VRKEATKTVQCLMMATKTDGEMQALFAEFFPYILEALKTRLDKLQCNLLC